jgi:heat-inducible transcriptional repressor
VSIRVNKELSDRQKEILQAVIEDYIATAEPVGSRSLTKRHQRIRVSPATVRNTMADLEELGYLSAPHASAGRVPTGQAIRAYVEHLAQRGRISGREREIINAVAAPDENENQDISKILRDTGRVLSSISNHASLVFLPTINDVVFADIEFVPIRDGSVLAVFVAKSGWIQHRVVKVETPIEREDLRRMSNYLTSLLDGRTLSQIRAVIIEAMRDERAAADHVMRQALSLGEQSLGLNLADAPAKNVIIDGQQNFFDQPEFADIERMRKLLRAFEQKTMLVKLLSTAIQNPVASNLAESDATQVVFGAESSLRDAQDLALVVTSFGSEGSAGGRLGIVGPMRMDYARVIPLVEYTASALTDSFSTENLESLAISPAGGSADKDSSE